MTGSGTVNVLYAGSLVDLMEKQIGPAFKTKTGYTFTGFSAGSTALAAQIKGKVRKGDVFVSASPDADTLLMGSANGDWVSWYLTFATAPLVLGYSTKSTFAEDIRTKPWYDVITMSGFRVGTTDPKTDPKGKLVVKALTDAGKEHPALLKIIKDTSTIFPEETLVGDLQSGQLDAGFFYSSEAKAANIPTVPLTGQDLKASYTVSVLKGAPNESGAEAFVQYLLGSEGQAVLTSDGFSLVTPPKTTGTGVPSSIAGLLSGA
ncbi:molybdate/tungstate transport system substrate-binding protein [Rudaeicoccus suwonensis]|uniref:Molybdate/tungstate transport system substrate-binding protein n=2 Tax=Rudaeicoccus suwonensis TaxID=657409 RepID=A0A561E472_9MICO|nr:molybdate/tungstate transport system substrate-binding protein [Rudaeicoccus suwonensis]